MSNIKSCMEEFRENAEEVCFGDLCQIISRSSDYYKQDQFVAPHEGAMILSPPCIVNNKLVFDNVSYYSWEGYYARPRDIVDVGDIILCKSAAPSSPYKSALVDRLPEPAITNPNLFLVKHIKCNPHYLQLVLSSSKFQQMLKSTQSKSVMPLITSKNISQIKIFVPPIEIQDAYVDLINAFQDKHEELIKCLTEEINNRNIIFNHYIDKLLWKELTES